MKTIAALTVVLALFAGTAFSSGLTELIKKKYSPDASFVIDFEQNIYWSVREKTSKKNGTIILASGDRFRVELERETFVSNGTVFWQYNQKNRQVIIRNLSGIDLSFHPSNLLSTFLERYTFSESDGGNGITVLSASDTSAGAEYRDVSISAQRADGMVTLLAYTDKNDNRHTYRFKKTVFNKKQSSSLFEFEVPANADIIDKR